MASTLVRPADVRALVNTSKSDQELQALISREETALIGHFGAHYVDAATTVTETLEGGGLKNLYLRRPLSSVSSVVEDDALLTVSDDYRLWAAQGRIERRPAGSTWGDRVVVIYVPADDREQRKAAIIELVRLALERTAMKSESIAGEYSFTAPDWELRRVELYRRLGFVGV